MIKILPLPAATPAYRGGQYVYCLNLYNLFKEDEEIKFDEIRQPKCKQLPIVKKLWFDWKDLRKRLEESECDIVLINGYAELSVWQEFIMAHKLKKKIVYAPHFHPYRYLERPLLGKLFFNVCLRPLLKWTSAILTIGKTDTTYFRNFTSKVYMIPHHNIQSIATSEKIKRKDNMILFIGRNESNKGMEYLYALPEKFEVHCVTGGELLRKDFIQHENIPQEELDKLYSESSLVVIPSRYEAFSYVALEAFAHGTPVVMSSNVKIADHLSGEKGYSIFRYGDINEFLHKVEITIGSEVDTRKILDKFNQKTIKEQYIKVFNKVYKG